MLYASLFSKVAHKINKDERKDRSRRVILMGELVVIYAGIKGI